MGGGGGGRSWVFPSTQCLEAVLHHTAWRPFLPPTVGVRPPSAEQLFLLGSPAPGLSASQKVPQTH